ncbi:hypothetical protein [Nocardia sp. JMUB6875]|uniref:hypothetical protein n=1 Tax=Nocardia sp. JMUB6875 TaxID=3158170 RepID=UPI0034E8CEC3
MGIAEAVLTGDITDVAWFDNAKLDPFACHSFRTRFGTSGSFNHGEIVEISLPAAASTPEGITVGSTRDQVRAAYPDLYIGIDTSSVRVPGNPAFKYGIGGISAQQASGQTVNALTIFKAHTDICRQ